MADKRVFPEVFKAEGFRDRRGTGKESAASSALTPLSPAVHLPGKKSNYIELSSPGQAITLHAV